MPELGILDLDDFASFPNWGYFGVAMLNDDA
jgi:hypothetical protein